MLIRRKSAAGSFAESAATPTKRCFATGGGLLKGLAAGPILAAGMLGDRAPAADGADPSAGLYPAKRNRRYTLDRPITAEKYSTTYNNFYEFGFDKIDLAARRRR